MGVGTIFGPVIGSALYDFFGFQVTFFIIGGAFILLAPALYFVIPTSINAKDDEVSYLHVNRKLVLILKFIMMFKNHLSIIL